MNTLLVFSYSVLGGIAIALGGTAYFSVDNRYLGAFLFTAALFTICTFSLNLFTGRVIYVLENDRRYAFRLIPIWLGNLLGTWLTAQLELLTRYGPALQEKAMALCLPKLDDSVLSIFILSVFCNILVSISVEGYQRNGHEIGKYLSILFGVMVFVLCGFEHCVANMYYFSVAGLWSGKALVYVLVMTAGNALGGVLFPAARMLKEKAGAKY